MKLIHEFTNQVRSPSFDSWTANLKVLTFKLKEAFHVQLSLLKHAKKKMIAKVVFI